MNLPLVQGTDAARQVDELFLLLTGVSLIIVLVTIILVFWFCIKYRRRENGRSIPSQSSSRRLEWSSIGVMLVVFMVFFVWGSRLFLDSSRPPANAHRIFVVGKQWMWKFQHPNGKREINTLHLPVGQPIKLLMISQDVIHSFFIPAFRAKRDVLPGRYTTMWFTPNKPGRYHLFCSEFCGTNHARMRGEVIVEDKESYDQWAGAENSTLSPVQAGHDLFKKSRCASCHGKEGEGLGPSLENIKGIKRKLADQRIVIADENYLRESIVNPDIKVLDGYDAVMPPYQGQFSEEELIHLVRYLEFSDSSSQSKGSHEKS